MSEPPRKLFKRPTRSQGALAAAPDAAEAPKKHRSLPSSLASAIPPPAPPPSCPVPPPTATAPSATAASSAAAAAQNDADPTVAAAPAATASSSPGSSSDAVQATTYAPVAPPSEPVAALAREQDPLDIGRFIQNPKVVEAYREKMIRRLFEWQGAALDESGVLDGHANLVYTAPTSGGKTLVAEVLLLRRLDEGGTQAKAIFVVPYKAIVDEKVAYFKQVLKGTGRSVAAYYGGQGALPVPPTLNVMVCTIEKAELVVLSLASQARLPELAVAVIDELHEVGSEHRGCVVESLLSKLVCFRRQQQRSRQARSDEAANGLVSGEVERRGPQLIAMSATLPNLATIGKWLDARVYKGIFRPVPLERHVVDAAGQVFDIKQ